MHGPWIFAGKIVACGKPGCKLSAFNVLQISAKFVNLFWCESETNEK